jgi:predicted metal-dependent hydrolase
MNDRAVKANLSRAIQQFNNQEFFNCHETLELIWLNQQNNERDFYRGILHIAVSLLHLSHKNLNGVFLQIRKAERRLQSFLPLYCGMLVEKILWESKILIFSFAQNKTKFYNETSEIKYPHIIWHESSFQN